MKPFFLVLSAMFMAILGVGSLPLSAQEIVGPTAGLQRMKPLAQGISEYLADHDQRFPPSAITDKKGKPLLSWRVALLPYLGEEALYRKFRLDEPWDSAHNKPLLEEMPEVYAPFDAKVKAKFCTFYQVFVGPGTVFAGPEGLPADEINDGADNTLLIVEAETPVLWTKPEDLAFDFGSPLPRVGGQFLNKFHAVLCDCSCRSLPKTLDDDVLRAIITPNGNEDVDF